MSETPGHPARVDDNLIDGNASAPFNPSSHNLQMKSAESHAADGPGLKYTQRGNPIPLVSEALFRCYRVSRGWKRDVIRRIVRRLEGGEMYSTTLRRIFSTYHGVDIGMYSHGGCFVLGNMPPQTTIGRYCSTAVTACAFTANHPMNRRSSHAVFYNPALGLAKEYLNLRGTLTIGNDVWIGHNALILPSVSSIGDGAVIGAGAVVHKDIPSYAVVAGHPCRVVRYRFSEKVIEELLASRWWEKSIEELLPEMESFQRPLEGGAVR